MRLSKIKLAGFKSFIDPTIIKFPGNLVSILGPNGCGKSNTIDAVRWVMGESSAKNLRGESMTDVIFNGSSARKPVGQAMVELIFDNSDAKLGGQYANFNEVSVKRTVNRDAQSFYYLNNTRCRRKDVTELFLGTGLGPRSYAIVEQGTISKLIESKPEELRVYIEEAAGISKYKERRRETETRIRHTRENLERLADIRGELEKQLSKLQRQARSAKRYKELKHNERQVKAQLYALQWRGLDIQANQQQKVITEKEIEFEKYTSELRQLELSIEQKRESHQQANENFNTVQGEFYRIGGDIARLEQSIEHAHERKKQHQDDYLEATEAYNLAKNHVQVDEEKIVLISAEISQQEPVLAAYQQQAEMSEQQLHDGEQQMHDWQVQWDDFNHRANQPSQTAQLERSHLNQFEQQLIQRRQKINQLEKEQDNSGCEILQQDLEVLHCDAESAQEQSEQLTQQLEQQKSEMTHFYGKIKQLNDELNQHKNKLSQCHGKKSSLVQLQTIALGKDNHQAINWLKEKHLVNNKRLTDSLNVLPGWEKTVEYLLGDILESVCVTEQQFKHVVAELSQKSPLTFPLSIIAEVPKSERAIESVSDELSATLLVDLLDSNTVVNQLLDNIYALQSLSQAIELLPKLTQGYSIITQDGYYLGHGWFKVVHTKNEKTGVLLREQALKELQLEINHLTDVVEKKDKLLENLRLSQIDAESLKEQFQMQLSHQNMTLSELNNKINNKKLRIEHLLSRQQQVVAELQEYQQDIVAISGKIDVSTAVLHQALDDVDSYAEQKQQLLCQKEELQQQLLESKNMSAQDKERSFNLQIKINALNSELNVTQQALFRATEQHGSLKKRCEQLNDLIKMHDDPAEQLQQELENYLSLKIEVDENLSQARNQLDNLDQKIRSFETQRVAIEQTLEMIRNQLEKARIFDQELLVKRRASQENLDQSGYSLTELLLQIPENAEESNWKNELKQLALKVQGLGAINLAAIEEYQEQQQRKEYLDSQNADLVEALTTLEGAISKIDKETRTRFKETFDTINAELKLLFPRLFGGGQAYLDLTGDDFLNTGVTIMARPPGKRNSTIHLLSGGEKAMTAVALVFAIFSLNPAPFCMLDEVDAPLDEANVGRFCQMVKEMSEHVQFIYITHNKTTMEMSDYLCGVTMKEAGVSRIVDVDINEAVDMIDG